MEQGARSLTSFGFALSVGMPRVFLKFCVTDWKDVPQNRESVRHTRAQTVTFTTDWSILPTWVKATIKRELKTGSITSKCDFRCDPCGYERIRVFNHGHLKARSGSAYHPRGNDLMLSTKQVPLQKL